MTDAERIAELEKENRELRSRIHDCEHFFCMTRLKLTLLAMIALASVGLIYLCFYYWQPFAALLVALGAPFCAALVLTTSKRKLQ